MRTRRWVICTVSLTLAVGAALAWHGPGHSKATRLVPAAVAKELPAFFVAGIETVAHCARDPDLFRLKKLAQLRDAEAPEHYFDLELLEGADPPTTRSAYLALLAKKDLRPAQVGCLPYAIAEWTQRLTLALAEHRRWPDNPHVRAKCLVYAGLLAHYAQDACQPLHTTIHYNGRAGPDGKSPRSGIHQKVDDLLEKVQVLPKVEAADVGAFEDVFAAALAQINRSHALVDKVYELEKQLPQEDEPLPADSPVAKFATERLAASARFTASLYLTAWRDSAKLELPTWHRRADR